MSSLNQINLSNKFSNPTPYQGKKRCFGEYACQNCKKIWKSANSKANTPQQCTRCLSLVYPTRQSSLDNVFKELRNQKEVKFAYLEKLAKQSKEENQDFYQTSSSSNSSLSNSSPLINQNPMTAFDFHDFFNGIVEFRF